MADTHVLIFAEAALPPREAGGARLSGRPGIGLAGVASDLAAVTSLPAGQPGAVLVDQSPPRPDLVRRLKASVSDCGLLLLVDNFDLGEVIPLLQAGATGCISRDSPVGDLARGIIAAGRGEIVLPPAIDGRARRRAAPRARPAAQGDPLGRPGGWFGGVPRGAALRPRSRSPAAAGAGSHQQRHGADVDSERAHGGGAPAQHLRQVGRALTHRSGAVGREAWPRAPGIGAAMATNLANHASHDDQRTRVAVIGTLAEFHREPIPYNLRAPVRLVGEVRADILVPEP